MIVLLYGIKGGSMKKISILILTIMVLIFGCKNVVVKIDHLKQLNISDA